MQNIAEANRKVQLMRQMKQMMLSKFTRPETGITQLIYEQSSIRSLKDKFYNSKNQQDACNHFFFGTNHTRFSMSLRKHFKSHRNAYSHECNSEKYVALCALVIFYSTYFSPPH
jgi:hypothetical protein